MMTLKQRALIEVAKTCALALAIGAGTGILFNTVPLAIIGIGACSIMIVYGLKMVYDTKLAQLEAEEKLKN
jgi:uncharacterized membrane protein YgaE (UPF0421/DUF939 family)